MRLLDHCGLIPLMEPADYNAAGVDGESFSLAKAAHAAIVLNFGALTGNSILKVYAGATKGAKTTALTFRYRHAGADTKAAGSDQFAAVATSAALTLTATTFDHKAMVIDLDAAETPDGKPWITVEIDDTATALFVDGVAILTGPRYQPAPTAI